MIKEFFFVLFHPSYWYQTYPYSKEWDDYCKHSLYYGVNFKDITTHKAKFGDKVVWIENHPYASFTIGESPFRIRPSRYTIHRLRQRGLGDAVPPAPTFEREDDDDEMRWNVLRRRPQMHLRSERI